MWGVTGFARYTSSHLYESLTRSSRMNPLIRRQEERTASSTTSFSESGSNISASVLTAVSHDPAANHQ
jgi:hypothetical protein